jgi:CubicO group peptidase (beta-lactamase class C family)
MLTKIVAALLGLVAMTAPALADSLADFDAFLAQYRKEHRIPAMTAVIVKDGRIVWEGAYGWSDDEGEVATTHDTVFWIASVTKPIAAAAILAETDAGRLSLDTPMTADPGWRELCEWMRTTEIPFGAGGKDAHGTAIPPVNCERRATIRDLLSMRVNGDGGSFVYNPMAYARLGRIVSAAGGRPLRDIVRENVLDPAGMDNTALGWSDEKGGLALARLAPPFKMTDEGPRKAVFPDDDFRGAAGVYASARNLAKFDIALDAGKLLSRKRTDQVLGKRQRAGYDWGWFRQQWQGHRLLWHSGWQPDAYSALYLKAPDRRLALIVLANTEGVWWNNSLVRAEVEKSPIAARFLESFVR